MKQPIYLRLDPEQIAHVKSQPNQSAYINELVKADQHKETRRAYVFGLVSEMITNEPDPVEAVIALAKMLTSQICGEDQLDEIMRRAGK